jgi:hypothetical protein
MKTFRLSPIDGRKTLSNQHVNQYLEDGDIISDLYSYTTKVASFNLTTQKLRIFNVQSNTTSRHINAFLVFHGFQKQTKSQLKEKIENE